MKLTFFLLWAICLQVSAAVEAQTVTYSSRKVSLEKVFNEIAKQTGYQVLYNSYMVKDMGKVSVDFNHTPVKQAMNWALEGKPLAYSIVGNVIVIREKETTAESSVVPDLSEIHGTVVDSTTGRPLPGVTIRQQGGASGTTTDANGRFTINVPDDATLEITYLGYSRQVVHVNGRKELHVTLAEISTGLNQIVVVGYGTQRKRDLTSSIASIDSRDLRQVKTVSFTSAIEGKVPGVLISQTGGAPGSVASVRIRGVSTTGNNQPLYVVDGIPIDMGGMGVPGSSYSIDGTSIINPNDIASIEVLKDASASAIYGSRGANGVILITTKKGKEGKTHIELNASTGFSQPWRIPSFLNARQFATMANEIYTNSGLTPNPEWANPGSLGKGTDMLDLIFRDAPRQNYDLSISGGNSKLTSRLSLGYSQQDGIIIETSYKRYNAKEAIDFKPNEKIHIGGSVAFAATHSKGQNTDAMQGGILNLAEQFFPTLSPDSAFYGDALYYTKDGDNPILRAKTIDNELYNYRLFGNVFAAYTILPGLKFETNIGVDASFNRTSAWQGQIHRGFYNHAQATLAEVFNNSLMWDIENTLSYSKYFGLSNVSVVLGQSGNEYTDHYVGATGNSYLNESLKVINGSDVSLRSATGSGSRSTLASYFGRINYGYNDRYLLSASLRKDGSSNFGTNHKWGYFPSISAGWVLSEEPFMESLKSVANNVKLRFSWGEAGNDAIPAFGYLTTIQYGTNYVLGTDQSIVTGTSLQKPANPDLKWETDEQIDAGIDLSLFNDKVTVTADYYVKNTRGMLVSLPVSMESGFLNAPTINGGRIKNSGVELSVDYKVHLGKLNLDISSNLATLKNVVKSLGVGQPIVGGASIPNMSAITYTEVGQPIGYFRGYVVQGIYQTDAEVNKTTQPGAVAGDLIYKDVNGDGQLTDADRVKLGTPWPKLTYGLNITASYNGFDFNLFLQGIHGSQIFDANKASNYQMKYFNGNGIVNGVAAVLHHWTPGSGINNQPGLKFTDGNGNYTNPSSFFVESGDFMRVRNVQLGYTIPSGTFGKVSNVLQGVRVYVSAQNLFTFTGYSGFDPEVGSTDPMGAGIDTGVYPQPRTFLAGVDINF